MAVGWESQAGVPNTEYSEGYASGYETPGFGRFLVHTAIFVAFETTVYIYFHLHHPQ